MWSKFIFKLLQFFNGDGSSSEARSWHVIEVLPQFTPPSKIATLASKSSIAPGLRYEEIEVFFFIIG